MRGVLPLVLCVLVSCQRDGGGAPMAPHLPGEGPAPEETPPPAVETSPSPPPVEPDEASVSQACAAMISHRASGCSWAQRFPAEFAETAVCEGSLGSWVAPGAERREQQQKLINCWPLECAAAESCMVRVRSAAPPPPKRACGDRGTAPIEVDAGTWAKRRGADVERFSAAKTSVAEPIEVCGIAGEVEWMMRAACDDGSRPYSSPSAVNDGRDSWLERGGRCNSVLDRYTVKCPEGDHTVHIDRYVCQAK